MPSGVYGYVLYANKTPAQGLKVVGDGNFPAFNLSLGSSTGDTDPTGYFNLGPAGWPDTVQVTITDLGKGQVAQKSGSVDLFGNLNFGNIVLAYSPVTAVTQATEQTASQAGSSLLNLATNPENLVGYVLAALAVIVIIAAAVYLIGKASAGKSMQVGTTVRNYLTSNRLKRPALES